MATRVQRLKCWINIDDQFQLFSRTDFSAIFILSISRRFRNLRNWSHVCSKGMEGHRKWTCSKDVTTLLLKIEEICSSDFFRMYFFPIISVIILVTRTCW